MNWRLRLAGGLYRRATQKAGSDAALADLVRGWLERYVDAAPSPQSLGGQARAAQMTPAERSARMRDVARARWGEERGPR